MDTNKNEQQKLQTHMDNLRHDINAIQTNVMVPASIKNACAEMFEVIELISKGVRLG